MNHPSGRHPRQANTFRGPAAALALFCLATTATAGGPWKQATGFSTDYDNVPITVQQLRENAYYLHGAGSNMVLVVGDDGALMVDNDFRQISTRVQAAIAEIYPEPLDYIFNTHWHGDHTGMNAHLAGRGALIMAHEEARNRMMRSNYHAFFEQTVPPSEPAALPVLTFPEAMSLHLNGEKIDFFFLNRAHTDGDAIAWFPQTNLVHLGDLYISELYPIIDVIGGGDVNGYAPTLDAVLAMINDETIVVPGHGRIGTKADLKVYRDMIVTIRDRVARMMAEGLELEAILAANPSREFDPVWASDRVGPDAWVTMVHHSLVHNAAAAD